MEYYTRPPGDVIFHTTLQDRILPEWWGARPVSALTSTPAVDFDMSDSLQAAIDAACNFRWKNGRPLPPIPLRLTGTYACFRTLVARLAVSGQTRAFLHVEGGLGVANGGGGVMNIVRVPGFPAGEVGAALLRIEEGVDFLLQDLNLHAMNYGPHFGSVPDVVHVRCGGGDAQGRRGRLLRCGLFGGRRALLRIEETTRSARRRSFLVEGCNFYSKSPGSALSGEEFLTPHGLDLDTGPGVMVHADALLSSTASLPYVPSQVNEWQPRDATFHLRGGSVLVEGSQFHNAVGPRPSFRRGRALPDLESPDGQDFFLVAPPADTAWTHLTAMQCESQSWWVLGGQRGGGTRRNVVLIAVQHGNANWNSIAQVPDNEFRRDAWLNGSTDVAAELYGRVQALLARIRSAIAAGRTPPEFNLPSLYTDPLLPFIQTARSQPPCLVWWSTTARLVTVGCRLEKYAVVAPNPAVVDVATVFTNQDQFSPVRAVWRGEGSVIRAPRYDPEPVSMVLDGAIPRLVPIDVPY